ncbi:MAG TPA: transcriptional regulator [Desulfuromonadales bacterium]|nr:transcriptional regulator [Desulfuromonadales bacterium]
MKPKPPTILPPRGATIRRQIADLLAGEPLSARQISTLVGIPEKVVYGHLDHLRRTLHPLGRRLQIVPAGCRKCGFVFGKRERLQRPGRCPVCRQQSITEPFFAIR